MKASRLLSILMLLQSHERMTAVALARALEVAPRTILRDMDQLSAAGVPLWAERGREGGFRLQPGWSTQLTGMTEPEAHALLLAGLPGAATELGLGQAAATARLKLVASLPTPLRAQAAQVAERLHIDPIDWYRTADTPHRLQEVAEAVWRNRRLRVRYTSWRRTTWRELEPLGLILKAGAWYVAARETGATEVRTYRLASVLALEPGHGSFRRPRQFDLAAYWRTASARFEAERHPLQARVWMSERAMGWLQHARSPFVDITASSPTPSPSPASTSPSAARRRAAPERRGWRQVLVSLESEEQGARHLLGFGGEAEVIEPAALRQRVADMAARIQAAHGPVAPPASGA